MRCTKCHYLSFAPEPRCRNCGHDLSMDDLLGDFDLDGGMVEDAAPSRTRATSSASAHGQHRAVGGGVATMTPPAAASTTGLPLFMREMTDMVGDSESSEDEAELVPLVTVPARPRPPLGVRRTTPDPVKLRAKYTPRPKPEPDLCDLLHGVEDEPVLRSSESREVHVVLPSPVTIRVRLAAAAIDATLLGSIACLVTVFTMHMADLPLTQVMDLPVVPMFGFFALIAMGYELLFTTAQGQTVGKMVMGLRVVSGDRADDHRVSFKQASVRALALLPLGAGLVATLLDTSQAVHDRMAHTRVVRA